MELICFVCKSTQLFLLLQNIHKKIHKSIGYPFGDVIYPFFFNTLNIVTILNVPTLAELAESPVSIQHIGKAKRHLGWEE